MTSSKDNHASKRSIRYPSQTDKKRDKNLLRILILLNIVSGSATIRGALQVLPSIVAIPAGLIIHSLLLLLLSGSSASHAPKRKWIAVLVLSSLSVYTSFFTYYEQLTDSQQAKLSIERARAAHQEMIEHVYAPLKQEVSRLYQEYRESQRLTQAEVDNGLFSGKGSGFGESARELRKRELEKQTEYEKLADVLNDLGPRLDYPLEDLTPEQIYFQDQNVFAMVPHSFRPNNFDIERANYIDPTLDIALLTPFHKIQEGEAGALAAMGLALCLDSLILMLGTAILIVVPPKPKSIWERLAGFIASQTSGVKGCLKTSTEEFLKPANVYTLDLEKMGIPLQIIRELRGKCSVFLLQLYKATNPSTLEIDFNQLRQQTGEAVLVYRMLLDNLMSPGLGWVSCNNDAWVVNQPHYFQYSHWLQKEIARHIEFESNYIVAENPSVPVTIEIPANPSS